MSDNQFEINGESQEWAHLMASEDIGVKPVNIKISPPKEIIAALCKRLNLHSIRVLNADIVLQRNSVDKVIHIKGHVKADLVQSCVITTDQVQECIDDKFEAWFIDPNSTVSFAKAKRERLSRKAQSDLPVMDEYEDPEPVIDGHIDLGELVVQNLSLSLNPYPRVEGAKHDLQEVSLQSSSEELYDNPFAALKDWKSKEQKKDT